MYKKTILVKFFWANCSFCEQESDLRESLTVALLSWETRAIGSQWFICLERSERMPEWAMNEWANSQPCPFITQPWDTVPFITQSWDNVPFITQCWDTVPFYYQSWETVPFISYFNFPLLKVEKGDILYIIFQLSGYQTWKFATSNPSSLSAFSLRQDILTNSIHN